MVRLYHGTNGDNAASILSGNLRPSDDGRLGAGFYFATSKADAETIAKHRQQPFLLTCEVELGKVYDWDARGADRAWSTSGFDAATAMHPPWAGIPRPFQEFCVHDLSRITIVHVEGEVAPPSPAFYITNVGHPCFLDCDTSQTAVTVWGDGLDIGRVPDNITWELRPVAGMPETFYIINRAHGKFLDSHGSSVWVWGDGVDIGRDPDGIRWRREAVPRCPDTYYLVHVKTNKFLDTHGVPRTAEHRVGPRKDSGSVALWGDGHDKGRCPQNLQWRFVPANQ